MDCYVNVTKFNRQRSKGAGGGGNKIPPSTSSSAEVPQFKVITPWWPIESFLGYPFTHSIMQGAGIVAMANCSLV